MYPHMNIVGLILVEKWS